MRIEHKHREEIVRYGRMLHDRGFVAAMDGNLSVRLRGDRILVTPTCLSKGAMRPKDLVIVDLEGKRVEGRRTVTSEIGMHLLIYRMATILWSSTSSTPPPEGRPGPGQMGPSFGLAWSSLSPEKVFESQSPPRHSLTGFREFTE